MASRKRTRKPRRRSPGEGTVFFRPERGTFEVRYLDENAQVVRIWCSTLAEAEARRVEGIKRVRQIEHRRKVDPNYDQVAKPIEEHVEAFETALAANGVCAKYHAQTIARLRFSLAEMKVATVADLQRDRADRLLVDLRERGLRERSLGHYAATLGAFGSWLVERGKAPRDPFAGIMKGRAKRARSDPGRRRRGYLTDTQLGHLLDACVARGVEQYARTHVEVSQTKLDELRRKGEERALIYELAATAGLRENELRTLRWRNVQNNGDGCRIVLDAENTKARRADKIPVPSWMANKLNEWKGVRAEQTGRLPRGVDRVFDVPLHIRRRFLADLAFAKVERVDDSGRTLDFHSLRYTCAARWILAGASPKKVQAIMRHTDIRLTFDLYGRLGLDHLLEEDGAEPAPVGSGDFRGDLRGDLEGPRRRQLRADRGSDSARKAVATRGRPKELGA